MFRKSPAGVIEGFAGFGRKEYAQKYTQLGAP